MFVKKATFIASDPTPLNKPNFKGTAREVLKDQIEVDSNVVQNTITKIAQAHEALSKDVNFNPNIKPDDNPAFDLEAEIKDHPDSLYVKCYAIKADEPNDNGDYFGEVELRKATSSFVGVPVFTNHQNTDVEKSRGKVVHSWWDEDRNGIMIIARVDAQAYPQLARGIKEKYILGTSMGCQVQYSLCSVCHNYAETPDQYCEHIRERKTRQISANSKCSYHDKGKEAECPICNCKKGETNKFKYDGKSFEYNYGIKFIENSFVVNPACNDCGVTDIIDTSHFLAKVAEIQETLPKLLKAASAATVCTDQSCIKLAGQQELDSLNEALNLITSVSQSMLQQKEQLDLEFLSDLVNVLSDLQNVVDELNQQGYGRLQSPDGSSPPPEAAPGNEMPQPQLSPVNPTPGGSRVMSGPAGGVGTVTTPTANRKLDLAKYAHDLFVNTQRISEHEKKNRLELQFKIQTQITHIKKQEIFAKKSISTKPGGGIYLYP